MQCLAVNVYCYKAWSEQFLSVEDVVVMLRPQYVNLFKQYCRLPLPLSLTSYYFYIYFLNLYSPGERGGGAIQQPHHLQQQ